MLKFKNFETIANDKNPIQNVTNRFEELFQRRRYIAFESIHSIKFCETNIRLSIP